jgi:hypothetical protein
MYFLLINILLDFEYNIKLEYILIEKGIQIKLSQNHRYVIN